MTWNADFQSWQQYHFSGSKFAFIIIMIHLIINNTLKHCTFDQNIFIVNEDIYLLDYNFCVANNIFFVRLIQDKNYWWLTILFLTDFISLFYRQ